MWLCVACVAVCGCVWLCVAVCGCVWLCVWMWLWEAVWAAVCGGVRKIVGSLHGLGTSQVGNWGQIRKTSDTIEIRKLAPSWAALPSSSNPPSITLLREERTRARICSLRRRPRATASAFCAGCRQTSIHTHTQHTQHTPWMRPLAAGAHGDGACAI